MAHSVAVLREGRRLDYRLMAGQGDFRMAASSGIVFAEALLGRDGRVSAQPGAWYPEEVLSLKPSGGVPAPGGNRCHEDRPRSGGLSLRPLTKKGACSRLAQSPPASRPNPDGLGLSRSAARARKRASGRAHRLRELSRISRVPRGIIDEDDVLASSAVACTVTTPCQLHAAQKSQFGVTTTVTK